MEEYLTCMGIFVEWENNFFLEFYFHVPVQISVFFLSHVMWNYSHFFTTFKCDFLSRTNYTKKIIFSTLESTAEILICYQHTHSAMINGALEIDNFFPFLISINTHLARYISPKRKYIQHSPLIKFARNPYVLIWINPRGGNLWKTKGELILNARTAEITLTHRIFCFVSLFIRLYILVSKKWLAQLRTDNLPDRYQWRTK